MEFLTDEMKEIKEKIDNSNDIEEVRSLGAKLSGLMEEARNAEQRGGMPVASYKMTNLKTDDDIEVRTAFKNYIMGVSPAPAELRATTKTGDVASTIPTFLVDKIIEKMDDVGMLINRVERTSFAGGVTVSKSSTKPVASWVAEGAGSTPQAKTTTALTFTYNKLRCEISVSIEVATMTLASFERKFVENVAKAMVKAIEDAIINGDGTGKPKGILAETAPDGQAFTVSKGAIALKTLVDAEGAVPAEYENTSVWMMSKKTFMQFVGMVDTVGQPVARVNYGINGKPERYILGREVICTPYMPTLDKATATTFACIFDLSDYALNTVYDLGITKKDDWDTEDVKTKAVMSVDGKCVSVDSLVTITNTP